MGVTFRRAGFVVLVLAAVLLPLRRREQGPAAVASVEPDYATRIVALQIQHRAMREAWVAASARDSALALLPKMTWTGVPRAVASGFTATPSVALEDSMLAALWRRLPAHDSTVAVAMLLYNRVSYQGVGYTGTFTTRIAGREWCVPIVGGGQARTGQVVVAPSDIETATAPCTLYAAFGAPGSGVRMWLASTRYQAAQSNDWLERRAGYLEPIGPWVSRYDNHPGGGGSPFLYDVIAYTGMGSFAGLLRPPYDYGVAGIHCILGEAASCITSVLHPAEDTVRDGPIAPDMTLRAPRFEQSGTLTTVRAPVTSYLSNMESSLGPAKFRAVWQSDEPLEDAFQHATGQSLGDWTAAWAKRMWLVSPDAQSRTPDIVLGTTIKPWWVLLVLGWSAALVMSAGWVGSRRSVR